MFGKAHLILGVILSSIFMPGLACSQTNDIVTSEKPALDESVSTAFLSPDKPFDRALIYELESDQGFTKTWAVNVRDNCLLHFSQRILKTGRNAGKVYWSLESFQDEFSDTKPKIQCDAPDGLPTETILRVLEQGLSSEDMNPTGKIWRLHMNVFLSNEFKSNLVKTVKEAAAVTPDAKVMVGEGDAIRLYKNISSVDNGEPFLKDDPFTQDVCALFAAHEILCSWPRPVSHILVFNLDVKTFAQITSLPEAGLNPISYISFDFD